MQLPALLLLEDACFLEGSQHQAPLELSRSSAVALPLPVLILCPWSYAVAVAAFLDHRGRYAGAPFQRWVWRALVLQCAGQGTWLASS